MPAFALSQSLEEQLEELAGEVRRLRILRGASWLVAVLLAAPLLAIALDTSFELSGRARGGLLAGWIALSVVSAWWFVVRRIRETQSPEALARLIESKFPSLAERLRTLVELSESAEAGNGSRTMMALLASETERRTHKLDFSRAAPSAFSFRFAGLTAMAAALALAPILFVSGSGERVRRFVAPWHTPPVEVPYEVVVSSGDPVVKRGQSITVSGYLKKTQPNAVLPDSAAVIFREPGSTEEKKLPMAGDDKSAFTLTRPTVATDLEYCIECGLARSEWHTISAVDPVEIAAGSEVTIAPPAYALAAKPKRTLQSLADIDALQQSRAELKLKLNRRAQAVQLEWRPNSAAATAQVERLPVQLDESRTAVSVEVPLKVDGTLKWILFAEKDVRTEISLAVRVLPDTPPRFERVTGFPAQSRDVRKTEVLEIEVAAIDDIAVAGALIEYGPAEALDDSSLKSEPIAVAGLGTARAEGRVQFRIPAGAIEGQAYRLRLRIYDNRSIPELDLKPQQATYPDGGWVVLRVSSAAKPLAEQEIVAARDGFREKLAAIAKLLEKALTDVKGHRLDYQGKPQLEQDQSIRLGNDLESVRSALALLEAVAREAAGSPELRSIGLLAGELAEGEVRTAELQLKKVLNEANVGVRDTAALSAQHALQAALLKLAALEKAAELASANRLDLAELNRLAREQARLAEAAKKTKDSAELAAEQKKLREDLEKLLRESDALKQGEQDAAAQRRKELADELAKIAQAQKDLDSAIKSGEAEANRDQIDELAKKQKRLTERVKDLAEKTDTAARIAQTGALEQKSAKAATDFLDKKKPVEALTEQEKAARELERLADALEKAAGDRSDGRKAAQQLARWQEDLQRRVTDGLKITPRGGFPTDREKWTTEQQAIRDATKKLALPPSPVLDKVHGQAKDATAIAAEQLTRDPGQSAESLKKAVDTLNQLAEKAPTQQQRLKDAAAEVEKLRREGDAIAKEAEEIARGAKSQDDPEAKKKLDGVAEKQRVLAQKVAALDTPGSERRREMATDATKRAAEETAKGPSKESATAQADAKRQLDRLKQSLEGQTPADEKASELARLQKDLTENLAKLEKPTPDDLEHLQRAQKEIARQLQQLQAPEEQKSLQEAREAAQAADAALKKPESDIDELKKKSQQAKAASQQLADKLNGGAATSKTPPIAEDASTDLPSKKSANEARDLAAEQRELREQLARIAEKGSKPQPGKSDPLKGLTEKQKELAEAAEQLARDAKAADKADAAAKAEEAARKAHSAERKLDVGDAAGAKADADEAAKKLGEAGKMAGKPELEQRAEELRQKQDDLAKESGKKANDAESGSARQRAKQQELANNSRDLAGKMVREGPSDKPLQDAADSLKKASASMDQANRSTRNNKPGEAGTARQQAADALAQSQKAMEGTGDKSSPGSASAREAAEAGKQAGDLMKQAEKDLAQPNGGGAGQSMQQAADKLKQAASKLGETSKSNEGTGGTASGPKTGAPDKPTTETVPSAVVENLGKAWGDLPGEVKTKITAELKAKYGDDYARLIKLYFEQLAERK